MNSLPYDDPRIVQAQRMTAPSPDPVVSEAETRAACVAFVGGEGEWSRYGAGNKAEIRFKISRALTAALKVRTGK